VGEGEGGGYETVGDYGVECMIGWMGLLLGVWCGSHDVESIDGFASIACWVYRVLLLKTTHSEGFIHTMTRLNIIVLDSAKSTTPAAGVTFHKEIYCSGLPPYHP
jgi:hypothetical protein